MKQLYKKDCRILPLVLKSQWYDMVASGEKKEEYREVKPYYTTRIGNWMEKLYRWGGFAVIEMRRGYQKNAPKMYLFARNCNKEDWCPYLIRSGKAQRPEWGEPDDMKHFVFKLGDKCMLVDKISEMEGV